MRFLAILFCLGLASTAFAGDGTRICEPCLNVDATITVTPTYQTVAGSTIGQPNSEYAYAFCGQQGGQYRFTFCEGGGSAAYDTGLSVWSGTTICSGAYIVCNDDFCSLQSQVDFNAITTGDYICVVDGYSTATGTYTLAYRGPSCGPIATESTTWGSVKGLYR
jgi:putative hemolysin